MASARIVLHTTATPIQSSTVKERSDEGGPCGRAPCVPLSMSFSAIQVLIDTTAPGLAPSNHGPWGPTSWDPPTTSWDPPTTSWDPPTTFAASTRDLVGDPRDLRGIHPRPHGIYPRPRG